MLSSFHKIPIVFLLAGLCLMISFGAGCELLGDDPTPGASDVDIINYDVHIQSILDRRCTSCHGSEQSRAGLRTDGWTWLIQGSDFGEAVIPFSGDESRLIKLIDPQGEFAHPNNAGKEKISIDEYELLKRWVDEGALGPLGTSPFTSSLNLLYVAHESEPTVSVLDTDAWLVVRRVDLTDYGFSDRARVHHVAVEPDGSFWYASIGSPRPQDVQAVVKFNRFNELIAKYDTPNPGLIALHPTQDVLYVSRLISASDQRSLLEIRRSDMVAIEIPVTFTSDHALAIRPSGDFLFSSSVDVDQLAIVDLSNLDVSFFDIKGVKHGFGQFAVSPDGNRMWGTGMESKTVTAFDISNPKGIVQRQSLDVPGSPRDLTYTPDGNAIYVTVPEGNTVSIVNAYLGLIEDEIQHPAIQGPMGLSITSDGAFVFVSNQNESGAFSGRHHFSDESAPGTLVVIETASGAVVKVIELASKPGFMGSRVVIPTFR